MGFTTSARERTPPVLPMAAMIDIIFLLLVFFMTTSIMREQETAIDIDLQATDSGKVDTSKIPINITVLSDGGIFIGQKEFTIEQLRETLIKIGQQLPGTPIVIRGDKKSDLGITVQILDMCKSKEVNLTDVSLGSVQKADDL